MIDAKEVLRPGYTTKVREGFYAECGQGGELRHFGFYRDGEPAGWTVDVDGERIIATRKVVWEYESVDEIIQTIYRDAEAEHRVCLFCGKTSAEVAVLIAGPELYCYIATSAFRLALRFFRNGTAGYAPVDLDFATVVVANLEANEKCTFRLLFHPLARHFLFASRTGIWDRSSRK